MFFGFYKTSSKTPYLSEYILYIEKNELDKHTCIDIEFVVRNYQLSGLLIRCAYKPATDAEDAVKHIANTP